MSGELWIPSKLKEELRAEAERAAHSRIDFPIPLAEQTFRIGGLTDSTGSAQSREQLLREAKGWVAIGLRPIIDRMSSLDLRAHELTDDAEEDPELSIDHPANMIVRQPNPIFTASDLLGLAGAWLKLTGEAYYQILHDGLGVPRELWPIPPDRIYPVPSRENVISGYIVQTPGGQEIALETREVIRVWRPDPLRPLQGIGDLSPQASQHNAEAFRSATIEEDFRNDSVPRTLFEPTPEAQTLTPEDRREFQEVWRELHHRRRGNSRGVPAIGIPGFSLKEIGRNSDATATALIGDKLKEQLLAALGVPGSIVGMVVDVNRAAAETNRNVFDVNTIAPLANRIQAAFTAQLARQFDPRIVYHFRPFIDGDKAFELQQEQSDLDRKVITINDVRERRGLGPAPWGELPVGSFSDVPFDGEPDLGFESPSDLRSGQRVRVPPRTANVREIRDFFSTEAAWQRVIENERRFTSRFTKAMARIFIEQADFVERRLREQMPVPRARINADDVFNPEQFIPTFRASILDLQREIFERNGSGAFGVLQPGDEFNFSDQVQQRLEAMHARTVTNVNATTRGIITRALTKGQAEGKSVDSIAKDIRGGLINRKRARTIARTEVGKAAQFGQLASFAQADVVEQKQWNTSRDEFVRDSHVAADGQVVDLDGQFRLGSGALGAYPLDDELPAADLVNCRCFLTPVIRGE